MGARLDPALRPVGVGVETQARRKRPSADLYAAICKENGLSSEMVQKYCPEIYESCSRDKNGTVTFKVTVT